MSGSRYRVQVRRPGEAWQNFSSSAYLCDALDDIKTVPYSFEIRVLVISFGLDGLVRQEELALGNA